MDELQEILSHFKQGLIQNVFVYFDELKTVVSDEDAASFVVDELENIKVQFTGKQSLSSLFSTLEDTEAAVKLQIAKANEEKDYAEVMHLEEQERAIKIVKLLLKE